MALIALAAAVEGAWAGAFAPPQLAQAAGAPLELFPSAQPPRKPATRQPRGVEVDSLGAGVDSLGVLGPAEGGFGPELWQGSERETVEHLLARLPSALDSPALMDIARRLLLSNAAPPEGEGQGLLALRAERLLTLGDPQSAGRLIAAAPAGERAEGDLQRLAAEAALAAGAPEAACAEADSGLALEPELAFWRKLRLFCEIAAGNDGQAMVLFDLLRETSSEEESAFLALAAAALGLGAPPELAAATPLELALLSVAGAAPPRAILDSRNPAELAALARQAGFSPEARLAAGERAAESGVLSARELRDLYGAMAPETPSGAAPGAPDRDLSGPETRARLLADLGRAEAAERPPLLQQLLDSARNDGLELALSLVLAEELAAVTPQPELAWFAEAAGRALYLTGRSAAAHAWLKLARSQAAGDPEMRLAALNLEPFEHLSLEDREGGDPAAFDILAWAEAAREGDPDAIADQTLQLGALHRGLGLAEPLPWSRLVGSTLAPEPLADSPAFFALAGAAEGERLGESLLLVLRLIGEEGTGQAHPVALAAALDAFVKLGLTAEAESLAREAAARRGL